MNASQQTSDEVAERLFSSLLGTVEIMSVYLGDRLGWYRALAGDGPASAGELARRTDTQVRYAREWLEQQAVSGLLVVESDGAPDERRFAIPASTAEVMTDATSLAYLAPMGRMFGAVGPMLPRLLEAYRTGAASAGTTSAMTLGSLRPMPTVRGTTSSSARHSRGCPRSHDVLTVPGCRVLDVGCGGGWSSIALARAYPSATVLGVDIDQPSVDLADANAAQEGVADRVRFLLPGRRLAA